MVTILGVCTQQGKIMSFLLQSLANFRHELPQKDLGRYPLLPLRAVPADHGVRDVRQAAHPLEGAAHEAVLLLQLLKR